MITLSSLEDNTENYDGLIGGNSSLVNAHLSNPTTLKTQRNPLHARAGTSTPHAVAIPDEESRFSSDVIKSRSVPSVPSGPCVGRNPA